MRKLLAALFFVISSLLILIALLLTFTFVTEEHTYKSNPSDNFFYQLGYWSGYTTLMAIIILIVIFLIKKAKKLTKIKEDNTPAEEY